MIRLVRFCISSSRAPCTSFSLSLSSDEVASSRISTAGFLRMARAMATRCRCPPESLMPRSPTTVSRVSGKALINCQALARRAASMIS
nr:hypothetical protein [Tanacetum cinerariifolium]